MRMKAVQFIAIMTTALYLVPTGAHLFELLNKIALPPTEYLTVQKIYAGWSLFGVVVGVALLATLVHTLLVRADCTSFAWSLGAFVALAATQGLFWAFTYPVNTATGFWTMPPESFEVARRQWEYSMRPAPCSHLRRSSRLSWQRWYITRVLKLQAFGLPHELKGCAGSLAIGPLQQPHQHRHHGRAGDEDGEHRPLHPPGTRRLQARPERLHGLLVIGAGDLCHEPSAFAFSARFMASKPLHVASPVNHRMGGPKPL